MSQRYESADPDPYQNFVDSQHCLSVFLISVIWAMYVIYRSRADTMDYGTILKGWYIQMIL